MSKVKKSKKNTFQEDSLCPITIEENSLFDKIYFTQKNKLPTKITDTYKNDYDIVYVHNIILASLNQEKNNLPKLNNELKKLKIISETLQTYNAKVQTMKDIQTILLEIENINKGLKLIEYKKAAEPFIEQYGLLKGEERLIIIDQYLKLAKKYIVIQVTRIVDKKIVCLNCQQPLDEVVNIEGVIRCSKCNNEYQSINTTKYTDNYNMQYINLENDDENFTKALMRYQGLQNNPPKILYTKLDNYFKERGFPDTDTIRAMPYDDRGKKGNTNKKMLCAALANIGYSTFYEDVHLIGHVLWDWKLPDLTHLKDTILKHYAITQKAFYKIPSNVRQRISSLGTQYRLWRHLQLIGHECHMEDFKIAENNDSLQNHHRLWRMMCELSSDPDIYYID